VDLQWIIDKCLEKDRELRYQHASAIHSDLKRLGRVSLASSSGGGGVVDSIVSDIPSKKSGTALQASSSSAQPMLATAATTSKLRRTRKMWASLLTLLGALSVGGVFYWRSHTKVTLTDKDTIVLADFTNITGDAVFDETLRQALSVEVEQSPFLRVITEQRVQQTLGLMGKPPGTRLTPEITRELCQRTNSTAALNGSIAQIGSEYSVGLKAVDCVSDEFLAITDGRASDKNHVLGALNRAASTMRAKLGESLSSVQKFDTPVEQATTPSLEALHAFSLGVKTKDITGDEAALPLFEEAIKLDPNFAMAYALLGTSLSNLEERQRGAEMLTRAYDLRGSISEREKFYIEAYYYDVVLGDLTRATERYEHWAQDYPRDDRPVANLGLIYGYIGQHDKAVAQARAALQLQPASGLRYANLVQGYIHVGSLSEARSTVEEARTRNLDSPYLDLYSYQLAFVQHDATKMAEELNRVAGKPGVEDMLLAAEADTAAYNGHLLHARDLSTQATTSAQRTAETETAASYEAAAALREALFGNPDAAQKHMKAALSVSKGRDVRYASILALAFAGGLEHAQHLSEQLSKDFPEDTVVQSVYLPTIKAQIALGHHDVSRAIKLLKVASPYELGMPGDAEFSPSLYPVYVRGNADLAAGQEGEAAAEFGKILKWPGVVLNQPIAVLAYLGLARACTLQGDKAKAQAAYQKFFAIWRDADPDIRVLKQAKAEYVKLQ
jgi:tetratricopeptide (TPR) repeat protein